MSSENRDNLNFSFPTWMNFISFFCLIALARYSSIILNKSWKSGHPCLISYFRGNGFSFSLFNVMLAMDYIMLRNVPFIFSFFRAFIMKGCWIFSKDFSQYIDIMTWFLPLILFMYCITFIGLHVMHSLHPWNETWWWYVIFLMHCWILWVFY
jgi:hypothetical protein